MNKKFFTDIKFLRNAIDTNKLVVFVGAGISVDAGIPKWGALIDELKSEIEIPKGEEDYLRISQMYYNERQQKEFIDKIRSVLKHKKVKYNEIHESIFKLNPAHILTTNYDDLLEQVIKKKSLPFSIVSKDEEFPYALNTNLLVKIHGDLNDTDIVLKEDDYLDYSLNHPLIEAFLKSIFATKVVLFVGYGFSDVNLKMIIQTVRNILGKDFQNAYLLSIERNLHQTQRKYLMNKGINIVNFFDAENDDGTNYITDYLNGKNALNEIFYSAGENLSDKGQNLLNFLLFLSTYDKFNEPLTEKNIIDQIYLSLIRFSELKTLPPDFIANLYPFNNSENYVFNYEPYSLLSRNSKLVDLFFNQIEYVNDEVKYKPKAEITLSDYELIEIEKKLKEIICTLNLSMIYYLFKESKNADSFGDRRWSDESKKLYINQEKCNCLNCRINRFEFSSVISDAFNSSISETTSIQSDLELAYANHKLGNFTQAYRLFEEVANKAWQAGKYFSYYIAKHNIKNLRNLIKFYARNLNEDEKKKIVRELDDMDFDKLLFQIPYLGESEYGLLKAIRDDQVLKRAENKIYEYHEKVLSIYEHYKSGTPWIFGPFYPKLIEIELFKIITFYTNNYIVADEFSNIKKVVMKGIEAQFISYATNENYGEKLREFNKDFFNFVVRYGDSDDIKKITQKLEINKFVFNESDILEIIATVDNFLTSFFEENNFFGVKTFENKTLRNQINNDFFENKCRKYFSNIFVLLSGMNLEKEQAPNLVKNFIRFIKHENFINRKEIELMCSFMYKNPHLFSREDFEVLLESIFPKIELYNDSELLRVIAFVFNHNKLEKISNKSLIFATLTASERKNKKQNTIIYLWLISNEEIREELKRNIISKLDTKFDSDFYVNAAYRGIIDFNQYFDEYIKQIDRSKGNGAYTLESNRPNMKSLVFINAILFLYKMNVRSDDKRLEAFRNLADYMKFYLNPENFDYTNFKVEWLHIAGDIDVLFERFSKIPALKKEIEKSLKENFDTELAKLYTKYFLE